MVNVQYQFDPGKHFDITERKLLTQTKHNHENVGLSLDRTHRTWIRRGFPTDCHTAPGRIALTLMYTCIRGQIKMGVTPQWLTKSMT